MLWPYCSFIFACSFLGFYVVEVESWASPALEELESLDEVDDAKIFKAVFTSMLQWEKRQHEKKLHRREKRQQSSVCYKDVGCFEASGPFGYLDMLPGPPEDIDTKFLLYPGHRRRRSVYAHAEIPFGNLSYAMKWAQQGFNNSLPTKVLIHGFGSDCSHIWVYELRSALMAVDEMNIICVDWAKGAELPNYVKAATNTRLVGKQLSVFLKGLMDHTGLLGKNLHLIGFSLGAHVAGFAGAELGNLSRITGLDPAGPLFESQDARARLDQTDAIFVDVIHSNGENIILGGLGSWQPMGHVDFYPNGGRMQKGCTNIFVGAVSDIIWSSAVEGRSLCNHRRAYKFFTDSVSPRCHFPAFPCESYEAFLEGNCFPCTNERTCGNMGYYADKSNGRGQLYLVTRDEEPFCAHQYHVKVESSSSDIPITSYGKIQITLVGESFLNETFIMTRKDDDEMKLGHSISRIVVPHPILAEPLKIQVLYTAYSGWLSSGLTHWKIDRIILSDSYGKSSSICKKSLILESGVPVTLPLYPGVCNPENAAQDHLYEKPNDTHTTKVTKFVPTPVVKIGNEVIKFNKKPPLQETDDIFKWHPFGNDKDNNVDNEKESSRALNTRVIKVPENFEKSASTSTEIVREVVEPILKPHSNKIARSHDPEKDKEISEPILGPTTSKFSYNSEHTTRKEYNFFNSNEGDWVPSVPNEKQGKWKRNDDSQVLTGFVSTQKPPEPEGFNLISMTVQFLPQRLVRMFEQAEKYARETILPFVSAHTPKIIRNFIAPEEKKPKYVPLRYDEEEELPLSPRTQKPFLPFEAKTERPTTPYTHIQRISKKGELFTFTFTETTTSAETTTIIKAEEIAKSFEAPIKESAIVKRNNPKEIYIDLPVFDDDYKTLKYIPLIKDIDEKR